MLIALNTISMLIIIKLKVNSISSNVITNNKIIITLNNATIIIRVT